MVIFLETWTRTFSAVSVLSLYCGLHVTLCSLAVYRWDLAPRISRGRLLSGHWTQRKHIRASVSLATEQRKNRLLCPRRRNFVLCRDYQKLSDRWGRYLAYSAFMYVWITHMLQLLIKNILKPRKSKNTKNWCIFARCITALCLANL